MFTIYLQNMLELFTFTCYNKEKTKKEKEITIMTSKNFNRVLTVVVNKLNKCYFNFAKPENMKSVTIEKSVFLVDHKLGLEIDNCDMYFYITVDGARMYEIDLDNEVKDSNELFNRVQYLLALAYGDIYNGNFDELVETTETEESTEDHNEYEETTETEEATEDHNEYEEISDLQESTDRDRINYFMETHSFPSISEMYNDKCFCCLADRKGNECKGKETCGKTWKRYEAITNPEWHHVSLATLANIDFGMLDEKRQLYLQLYRELKELITDLHKCKSGRAYERRLAKMYIRNAELLDENKVSHDYINFVTRKISMSNVECGLWTSKVEEATGLHKSRRYNRHMLKY